LADWAEFLGIGEAAYPSWLLLSEVLEFDWYGLTIRRRATVPRPLTRYFLPNQPWPSNVPDDYIWNDTRGGVPVTWTATYAEVAGPEFLNDVVGTLRKQFADPECVRLVYWFRF
jgi:hypothetical protein